MAVRILLADDHAIVREGVRALLVREGLAVVAEAANGRDAVRLADQHRPDAAVLDLVMPTLNGLNAGREILQRGTATAVILLTMAAEEYQIAAALRAGIRAYLLKTQAAQDLVAAIREVLRGPVYLRPGVSRVVVAGYAGLLGVYGLLLSGATGTTAVVLCVALLGAYYAATDGVVPIAVSAQVPRPPRNASATGGQSASGESRNPNLMVGAKSPS